MNTEDFFLLENLNLYLSSDEIFELEDRDRDTIVNFVETTRFIQEIEQLFCVYESNLSTLLSVYTLYLNDTFERKMELSGDNWTDYSNINAYTISIISSGKTLIEAIEVYIKTFYKEDLVKYNDFKLNCLSKEYDNCFGYRFLSRIRDFSQHGHLPVGLTDTEKGPQVCFDLNRIIPTPHFNHNPLIIAELKKLREDIHKEFSNPARIAFTLTIAQYNLSIITIYSSFFKMVKHDFFSTCDIIDEFLTDHPEAIIKADNFLNGLVGYFIKDDMSMLHVFDPKAETREMFFEFSQNADTILTKEIDEMERLKTSYKWFTIGK